jgi:hypothetical protein
MLISPRYRYLGIQMIILLILMYFYKYQHYFTSNQTIINGTKISIYLFEFFIILFAFPNKKNIGLYRIFLKKITNNYYIYILYFVTYWTLIDSIRVLNKKYIFNKIN